MNEEQTRFISSSAFQAMPLIENRAERISSIYPENSKGVALVIHGLNLKPDKMDSIITLLTQFDIDVLKMSLSGHGKNYTPKIHIDTGSARMETLKRVSFRLWHEETYQAYDIAKKMSRKKGVPLFLVGYSLGGLMGLDLFATCSAAYFNRMVLLAPALNLHTFYYAAKFLLPFPKLVIPSFSPVSYRANFGTPVSAYCALFEAIKHLHQNMTSRLNVPTIVIIDPQDELVPYKRLEKTIKSQNLDHWEFHLLKKSEKDAKKIPHHLIIDESTVGKDSWKKMKHLFIRHLLG